MIRKHKKLFLLTAALTLLPCLIGLLLWNKLPAEMPLHWNIHGSADGSGGRFMAVFGLPLILLALHALVLWMTGLDKKNKEQDKKVEAIIFWICPLISLAVSATVFAEGLGKRWNVLSAAALLVGAVSVILGNLMPKCRPNSTIGIRTPWTLADEGTWKAVHRFGGKLWVACGFLFLLVPLCGRKLAFPVFIAVTAVIALVPVLYSWLYFRKHAEDKSGLVKAGTSAGGILTVICLAFTGIAMFTGGFELRYEEDSFTVEASGWEDYILPYEEVVKLEYRDSDDPGHRYHGFGNFRYLMGNFENAEFGKYVRYSPVKPTSCVVLSLTDGNVVVLGGKDAAETHAIYEELMKRIPVR